MATRDHKPSLKLAAERPGDEAQSEPESERPLDERVRAWRQRLEERERRRANADTPPPEPPSPAA